MIIDSQHEAAFKGYANPLRSLEKAFRQAGTSVSFYAFVAPLGNKMVDIVRKSASRKLVCIEGGSPAQAVKDVTAAVKL
jgi:hypothetical protein